MCYVGVNSGHFRCTLGPFVDELIWGPIRAVYIYFLLFLGPFVTILVTSDFICVYFRLFGSIWGQSGPSGSILRCLRGCFRSVGVNFEAL